jgi:hypothetical protein
VPVHWSLDADVLSLVFDGEYSFRDIADAARAGLAAAGHPVRLLVDATGTARLPDTAGVRQRIDLLIGLRDYLAGPVAIVASPGAMFGIARQVAQQADFEDRVTIEVFDSLATARSWIGDQSGGSLRGSPET